MPLAAGLLKDKEESGTHVLLLHFFMSEFTLKPPQKINQQSYREKKNLPLEIYH